MSILNLSRTQWFAILLVVLTLTLRTVITVPNFTPMLGASVVSGMLIGGPVGAVVPLVAMAGSDVVLYLKQAGTPQAMDFWSWMSFQPVIYLLMGLSVWYGRASNAFMGNDYGRGIGAGLFASISFFVVSNFLVWLDPWGWMRYPHTLNGLISCFTMGLPFWRNEIISTLLFIPAFVALFHLTDSKLGGQTASPGVQVIKYNP